MNLDRVIAVRTQKTVYKDGEESVKVFGGEYSAADVLSEALCLARAAEAGIRVPEVRAAEKTDGRWAIVTEYVDGQTADALMKAHPEKRKEYLGMLVRLQISVHEKACGLLPRLTDKIGRGIALAKSYGADGEALNALVSTLPEKNCFCHGDFNPTNAVFTEEGEEYLLDFSHAAAGDPLTDAAITYLYFYLREGERAAEEYLGIFLAESGAGEAEAKKRLPLAAAVWLLRANEEEKEKLLPFLKNAAETA